MATRVEKTVESLKDYRNEVAYVAQRLEGTLYKVTDLGGDVGRARKSLEFHMTNFRSLEMPEINPKDDGEPSIDRIFQSIEKWHQRIHDAELCINSLADDEASTELAIVKEEEAPEDGKEEGFIPGSENDVMASGTAVDHPGKPEDAVDCDHDCEALSTPEYMFIRLGQKIITKSGPDRLLTIFETIID